MKACDPSSNKFRRNWTRCEASTFSAGAFLIFKWKENILKQHKYFYQVNKSIGGADFETEIVVKDLSHLLEILEEVVKHFNDVIRGYEYFGYTEFPTLSIIPS